MNGTQQSLFEMIEGEGQCLKMTSVSDVFENAEAYYEKLSIQKTFEHLKDRKVFFIGARDDDVAPPEQMIRPIYEKLSAWQGQGTCSYILLPTNHGLCGQRTILAEKIGAWLKVQLSK